MSQLSFQHLTARQLTADYKNYSFGVICFFCHRDTFGNLNLMTLTNFKISERIKKKNTSHSVSGCCR